MTSLRLVSRSIAALALAGFLTACGGSRLTSNVQSPAAKSVHPATITYGLVRIVSANTANLYGWTGNGCPWTFSIFQGNETTPPPALWPGFAGVYQESYDSTCVPVNPGNVWYLSYGVENGSGVFDPATICTLKLTYTSGQPNFTYAVVNHSKTACWLGSDQPVFNYALKGSSNARMRSR
jgi:hypothetical protein